MNPCCNEADTAHRGLVPPLAGPAKVFCRRGKYKHCFMRMSDGNDVECQPSSLQISPELSIQITIEAVSDTRSWLEKH